MNPEHQLAESISNLACAVRESTEQRKQGLATSQQLEDVFHKLTQVLASKQDLEKAKDKIMSAISDFTDKVNASFDELGTAVDGIVTDVQFLKDEIAKLQGTAGQITPEDQALLDGIQARVGVLTEKVKALDAATEEPPTP